MQTFAEAFYFFLNIFFHLTGHRQTTRPFLPVTEFICHHNPPEWNRKQSQFAQM